MRPDAPAETGNERTQQPIDGLIDPAEIFKPPAGLAWYLGVLIGQENSNRRF